MISSSPAGLWVLDKWLTSSHYPTPRPPHTQINDEITVRLVPWRNTREVSREGHRVSVSLDSSPTISLDFSDRLWAPKTMPGPCGELQRGFTKYLRSLSFNAHLHQVPITKKGSEIKPSLLVYLSMTPYMLGLRTTEENKYWRCLGDHMPSDST